MIRAYALALGAGTKIVTEGFGEVLLGTSDLSNALSMTSGWLINIAIAERAISSPAIRRARRRAGQVVGSS